MSRLKEWINRLRTVFEGLAPRERLLVGGAGGLFALILAYLLVVSPILALIEGGGQRRETAEQEFRVMTRLARDYRAVKQRLDTVEDRIRSSPRGNLRTTLENLAQDASVRVESMEPQASPANDNYRETKVEVGLKSVDLASTVKYLHEIEASPQVLSVKSLRIRTRPDKSSLLDVTFTVSSFEPL
jgi:type II secretory pathway component PulM